jgi:hypothetical protein
VLRFNGATGEFIDVFTQGGDLGGCHGIIFGLDGHLYVADGDLHTPNIPQQGRIVRFDGMTGQYIDDFVPATPCCPTGLVFGPSVENASNLDLYVGIGGQDMILRFDGATEEFLGQFVEPGSGGLDKPLGLTFGPDGNLYVASGAFGPETNRAVLRYQGPSGPSPGAFIDQFVAPGYGGLQDPFGVLFGPDANGDGHVDLYVTNSESPRLGLINHINATVKTYDGVTGVFIDTLTPPAASGRSDTQFLTFTQTDPVTLEYLGE